MTRRRARSRLARLLRLRLRLLTWDSEFAADPCTPERAARARRHDRIARAHRSELARVLEVGV